MQNDRIEEQVGRLLLAQGRSFALAESCTGGLISHLVTNVPGSSAYYLGGVVAYSNQAKIRLLHVSPRTLELSGAVSEATVLEMARGARDLFQAEVGLSISGIAGPGGGTPEKPVGLTWIGLSSASFERAWRYQWSGDRLQVKEQSARQALQCLADYLGLNQ